MRKQMNSKIAKKLEEINEGVTLAMPELENDTKGEGKKPRANFIKFEEGSEQVHGFKDKIVIQKSNSLFEVEKKDKTISIPMDVLTFISLEYDINVVKNSLIKKYSSIQDLRFEGDNLYAKIDIVKSTDLALPVLNEAKRSLDELLSIDNIPEDIKHLAAPKVDPVRLKDGSSYILLSNEAVITGTILKNLVQVESLNLTGSKSEQREQRKGVMNEVMAKFLKSVKITETKIVSKKLYFGLVIDSDVESLSFEVSTSNIVACNISMEHGRFSELAESRLGGIRKGTKIKFVRTSDIVNSKTRELIYARNDMGMMRNPIIELVELTDKDVTDILTKDPNAKPMFMYQEEKIPAHFALFGVQQTKEVDSKTVRTLFSDFYTGEPVFFKDPEKGTDFLCPNIKQLALFALTGETELPIRVGVVSTTKDIAVSFETEK